MQTAAIRNELGDNHTFEFVEGSIPHPIASGMESFVSANDEVFAYLDPTSTASCKAALDDLEYYVATEGPFDGVMAFSQGAGLAASLMIRRLQQNRKQQNPDPLFRCAFFFCGGVPGDPVAIESGQIRMLGYDTDGEIIEVPTAHIWGRNDQQYPTFGPVLSQLCKCETKAVFVHEGGHEVPGFRDKGAVEGAVRVIRRTVELALQAQ